MSKEAIYDKQIAPLMEKIIKVCKKSNINILASFELDWDEENESHLKCTTIIAPNCKEFQRAYKIIRSEPQFLAIAISTDSDK